ncbi:MAG TPA: hypothetical protein VK184_03840 [Nostocaceae cyanobacterium]|nr:hypothetical protein [Nostocaceae cyanobacterium]
MLIDKPTMAINDYIPQLVLVRTKQLSNANQNQSNISYNIMGRIECDRR